MQRPLTIALVVDSLSNFSNGTANSAYQLARELTGRGNTVRLIGVGAPNGQYRAREQHIPVATWFAHRQQTCFARPSALLFRRAFKDADVIHIYEPFSFGRHVRDYALSHGIPVTAGFHIQPENIMYSLGVCRFIPGLSSAIYTGLYHYFYKKIRHIHVPTQMEADFLQRRHYRNALHVISNGYQPDFIPGHDAGGSIGAEEDTDAGAAHSPRFTQSSCTGKKFVIAAAGRLNREKDHITLIRAIGKCRHNKDIELRIAGTGPLYKHLISECRKQLANTASVGFRKHSEMPRFFREADLMVHSSIADIEGVSVLEGMACGLVPVIASSRLSAAGDFALTGNSLFPAGDAETLAQRIDWWIEHPESLHTWGRKYAEYACRHYNIARCARDFELMERAAIRDARGNRPQQHA